MSAYQELKDHLITISNITKGSAILEWDMEVMMPPYAATERGQVLATLGQIAHEKMTDPKIADLISKAEQEVSDAWDRRNVQLIRENYLLASKIPSSLVFALEEEKNKTFNAWHEAKSKNDWAAVAPVLKSFFALVKERATIYADVLGCPVYDAQMQQFARGNTQEKIDPLFAMLRQELPPVVQQIFEKQKSVTFKPMSLDVAKQEAIVKDLAQKIGYSFERGRVDKAVHPFSGGTQADSRITTRYNAEEPFSSMYGIIHEIGHALYTQNLPIEWVGQPVGGDANLSLHESQSLIREKQAGLNKGFIQYLYQLVATHDEGFAAQASVDDFTNDLLRVRPSFIRVDADEATYPLHIVLRYEIEKKLFNGSLAVQDIPEMWNAEFKSLFGLDVSENRLGCMQDIHWYWGLFGYFPTYTQGALYAAQLFHAIKRDVPHVEADLAKGDFTSFDRWLNTHIHSQGQMYDAADLIERATGAKPSAQYFLDHLKNRYL